MLLLGMEPYLYKLGGFQERSPRTEGMPPGLEVVADLLARATKAKALSFPAHPLTVIEWALDKGLKLPSSLVPAGHTVKGGSWVRHARAHLPGGPAAESSDLGHAEQQHKQVRSAEPVDWIELLPNQQFLEFRDLPELIAGALWPSSGASEEEDMLAGFGSAGAEENLVPELGMAVQDGRLPVLDPLTRGPHPFPIGAALELALVRAQDLADYVADRGIGVRHLPHFDTEAWPQQAPQELHSLPPERKVAYTTTFAAQRGSGVCRAGDYRAEIDARIARQAEGFFTLNEAAQVLADRRPGVFAETCVRDWLKAHAAGTLPIHQGESRFPIPADNLVRDFFDLVEMNELDVWLKSNAGYGFPSVQPDEASALQAAEVRGAGPEKPDKETQAARKEAREDERLHACEAQGLVFDKTSLLRLPDGIGKVALTLGIKRQSLTVDVKAALRRRSESLRNGKT